MSQPTCKKCGKELPSEASFCPTCGTNKSSILTFKNCFKLLSIVFIGAAGSALWDLSKPTLGKTINLFGIIVGLGIDSLNDTIYRRASYNTFEYCSNYLNTVIIIAFIFLFAIALNDILRIYITPILIKIFNLEHCTKDIHSVFINFKLLRFYRYSFYIVLTCFIMLSFRESYICNLIFYRDTLLSLTAPYTSDLQHKTYLSRFKLCKGKNDFIALTDELQDILRKESASALERFKF